MSLALARKYRPSTFDDLIGQESVSQTLSQALDGDRLSHAYLFSGLRGSGKTSTARIFAKALLCERGESSHPCNECIHCSMANENRHMDIIEMDAASNRGIDDIKDLIEHTKYKPSSARYKIFIIDEVHMLTPQAFNALLKTLEEPPPFIKFVLATTDPLKLPTTILSRTQHFRFKKIAPKLVLQHLEHILNREDIEYERSALEIITRSGAGSLRDSLTLLDQAIVYSKNHVDVDTVTNMLGIIEPSLLEKLLDDILKKDEDELLSFIKLASDYEAEMIIDELTLYLKDLLLSKSHKISPMIIDRFFRILADAKPLLNIGGDEEFVLSLTLFKMMEALEIKDIDHMIKSLEKELRGVKVPDMVASATPTKKRPKEVVTTESKEISAPIDTSENHEIQTADREIDDSVPPSSPSQENQKEIEEESFDYKNSFDALIKKIYDRDADLGSCFERNITFEEFSNHTLTWGSTAQGVDRDMLIKYWSIIKMFVQELFGIETKIVNIPKEPAPPQPKTEDDRPTVDEIAKDSSDDIPNTNEAVEEEKEPNNILKEPMIEEILQLFDPKKVVVKRKV
ncbi:DNA polymerase III subunits gamma and tau [hydrothermal vent metagenome]|uniref:DNA-directed DNA polymerase n=1 Tax=hydrothermal vent metagenome TaxID=652676 RepID=A0A1W1BPH8_9ZZZZ